MIQWAVELNKFNVQYKPKEVIKAQVLANFIVEFTPSNNQQDGDQGAKQWVVHVDGSSTHHASASFIRNLKSLSDSTPTPISPFKFSTFIRR